MACIMKNKLKGGNVSYTIQVKVKDPKTEKTKTKVMTWKKPKEMKDSDAKRHVDKLAIQFEEKCRKQIRGLVGDDEDIAFEDFAKKWLERTKDNKSILYYEKAKQHVNKFVDDIIMDAAVSVGAAFAAVQAAGQRLDAYMDDIKADAFFLQFFSNDLYGVVGDPSGVLAAV